MVGVEEAEAGAMAAAEAEDQRLANASALSAGAGPLSDGAQPCVEAEDGEDSDGWPAPALT